MTSPKKENNVNNPTPLSRKETYQTNRDFNTCEGLKEDLTKKSLFWKSDIEYKNVLS